MASINQNDSFYANNKRTLKFTLTNKDASPPVPLPLTGLTIRWALSKLNDDGSYNSKPALKKSSTDGGIVIVDANNGTLNVLISPADTAKLAGKYYHELEVVDSAPDPIVVATGVLTIIKNLSNS